MAETAGIPSRLYTFDSRPGATATHGAFVSADRRELVLRLPAAPAREEVPAGGAVVAAT